MPCAAKRSLTQANIASLLYDLLANFTVPGIRAGIFEEYELVLFCEAVEELNK